MKDSFGISRDVDKVEVDLTEIEDEIKEEEKANETQNLNAEND